jgi:hypothetical protein
MTKYNPLNPPEDACLPIAVRFLEVRVEPWPDGKKVRVHTTLTPFLNRPNLSAKIQDEFGREVCSAEIIETMDDRMLFTLHLRGEPGSRHYSLEMIVFYEEIGEVDRRTIDFDISSVE